MTETNSVARSVTLDVFVPDENRQAVLNAIRHYRAVCRQCYATLLLSQAAGAAIEVTDENVRVQPSSDRSHVVGLAALGAGVVVKGEKTKGQGQQYAVRGGSALGYEMRDWVLREQWPSALSFVWDSIRRDVVTVWQSKDPEFTRAGRGWLALQGARGVAQFNWRGIGFPLATARPKLAGHGLTLKWDRDLGAVQFELPNKLDGGRYYVWKQIRDGADGWKMGTLFLNERDGRLRVSISYHRPLSEATVDAARVCKVSIRNVAEESGRDVFISIAGPDGEATFDAISGHEVAAWLRQRHAVRDKLENRRASCGNPRRPWGHRHGWLAAQDVLSRATLNRERGVQDRNHAWTRRIVTRAAAWRCGQIHVENARGEVAGFPWNWTGFKNALDYKAKEVGAEVLFVEGGIA